MENFEEIDVQKARVLIDQGDIAIVDVRDTDSYEAGHIENSVSVNDSNIEEFVNNTNKAKPILCYCYMGHSSQGAAQYFKDNGFETVYSLTGGYTQWQMDNDSTGESTEES